MSTGPNSSSIPVSVGSYRPSTRLHWQRRAAQVAMVAIFLLIPISGLLRIDPIAGAFVVFDRQIWWSDFFLVFGLWIAIAAGLVAMYSFVGTAYCGWACPQNTLAEWANFMTRRLLGKRAEVSLSGERMQVATAKNKPLNWLLLSVSFVAMSMFFALIPMFYFYTPSQVWSFITLRHDPSLASSLHYIYTVFVLVILLDIAVIRHFMCRFMCIYKVWQHGFKTKQTLHVVYDAARASECARCNYCTTACFIDLDPKRTDIYDSCINCGECITACNNLQARKGKPGLLRFEIGERKGAGRWGFFRTNLGSMSTRMKWTLPFFLFGVSMFAWGIADYEPYHIAAYRADTLQGSQILDYRVRISNKRYRQSDVQVSIEGLDDQDYQLEQVDIHFDSVGMVDINLRIEDKLSKGLHRFLVKARSQDGWTGSYRIHHFVG